jgi:micrococcal nuclease
MLWWNFKEKSMNQPFQIPIILAVPLLIGATIYQLGAIFQPANAQQLQTAKVTRIVDGDTVRLEGYKESFRLIGIDTPESRRNDRAKGIAARTGQDLETIVQQGKQASAFTKKLLEGKTVRIEWDVQRRDRYQRNLAYLWLEGKMANLEIVRAGYADPLTIAPNVRYSSQFVQAAQQAREARRGLWR